MVRMMLLLGLPGWLAGCSATRTHVGVEVNSDGAPTRGIYETTHDQP